MSTEYEDLIHSISRAYVNALMENDEQARHAAEAVGKSYGVSRRLTQEVVTELTRHFLKDPMVGVIPAQQV